MTVTVVLTEPVEAALRGMLDEEQETAAVLLTHVVEGDDGSRRLLACDVEPVPGDAYVVRTHRQLVITSGGYVPALGRAEREGFTPLWLHTHPGDGASPQPSDLDEVVDDDLAEVFRIRSGSEIFGSLVLASERSRLRFTGRLVEGDKTVSVDQLLCVGSRIALTRSDGAVGPPLDLAFDRNVRAFGDEIQRVLGAIRVGIVGCGGTGSAIAEQLVRLGVRHMTLIDPDRLSASNVTRVYGSTPPAVGCPKVDVLADHLRAIAPDAELTAIASSVLVEDVARRLATVDLIFGCTDDNAGRLVLSRISTYLLVPVIDCGVLLSDHAGQLQGIYGRVTVLHPGAACLVCRDRIDLQRAAAEALDPEERLRRTDEGYAPALPGVEPAVIAYTTLVAAYAVGELLERLIGYGPLPRPTEVVVRIHDREVSTNEQAPREHHYCHPASGKLGRGVTAPFLEQTWAS